MSRDRMVELVAQAGAQQLISGWIFRTTLKRTR